MGITNSLKRACTASLYAVQATIADKEFRDCAKTIVGRAVANITRSAAVHITRATQSALSWFKSLTSSVPASARGEDTAERVKTFNEVESVLPSCFSLLYTSKDGKYCLYETKDGHLISANTDQFV